MFPVSSEKEAALRERMAALGIREEDIEEHFIRSGGHGGQNVNKTATCVYLKHLPTATEVKCQQARTQGLNRYYARVRLCAKIETAVLGALSAERARMERIRRQKRRRSRRAKEKVLESKHRISQKKSRRSPVPPESE
jgi:protein subunit release factor B